MLLKDTRLWTGGKKAKKMPEIRKMPNQNLPAKWNKKTPDFWNLALKTPIWQPCVASLALLVHGMVTLAYLKQDSGDYPARRLAATP